MTEYKVKVRVTSIGYIPSIPAHDGQDLWDKVVKQEGYDPDDIEDLRVEDVEPLEEEIIGD